MLHHLDRLPTLAGARVRLRWLTAEDAPDLFTVFSNPTVMRYWSRPPMTAVAEAEALVAEIHACFARHRLYQWGIEHADRVVGHVTLSSLDAQNQTAEIGFALAEDRWGRGLATEAVRLALTLAFDTLHLRRVEADVDPRNHASLKLLQRVGFVREGLARERWFVGGQVQDSVILGLLRREWETHQPA